ncbi:MAG: response regulator transcription factor [Solirubrobacteraceae bacterium]
MIRVAVLDDHPVVWRAVQAGARLEPDLQYIGHGADGAALARLLNESPDVILVDVRLGDEDGIALCEQAVQLDSSVSILVFSAYGTPSMLVRALNSGAAGFILKDADIPAVFDAIRHVHRCGSYIDPRLAGGALRVGRRSEASVLTKRELEILALAVNGSTNREIAESLVLSQHTIKYHIENIKFKLGARRRSDLVRLAVEQMLI